jgi:hypothetical protein
MQAQAPLGAAPPPTETQKKAAKATGGGASMIGDLLNLGHVASPSAVGATAGGP